ncbi:hotdog fold thioesterase [Actinospica durhamensis]|uniref:Hotdog fold thioesterase n=1 Tax=Actinospica durhamensis TaxID=1508375 RepID=A0A941EPJ9_9ACTN|nr:hotdog fold thioesterase [Actinospica durhamensis]MBR7834217.1 hotdog fold thioesterase [Actinospica durhamensis]
MSDSPAPSAPSIPADFEEIFGDVYRDGGQLAEKLGIEFKELDPQRLVATMPVEGNRQPLGLLHGGASVALAETLGSIGAALHAGPGKLVVGVDINATHHRAAAAGLVTGTATPLHLGRGTATYEVAITDEQGKRVCTSRITCLIREK